MATTKIKTSVYLDADIKQKAQSEAFNIFLAQSVKQKGIPFDVEIPNKDSYQEWSDKELKSIGKIGFKSSSFVEDSEDYSKW